MTSTVAGILKDAVLEFKNSSKAPHHSVWECEDIEEIRNEASTTPLQRWYRRDLEGDLRPPEMAEYGERFLVEIGRAEADLQRLWDQWHALMSEGREAPTGSGYLAVLTMQERLDAKIERVAREKEEAFASANLERAEEGLDPISELVMMGLFLFEEPGDPYAFFPSEFRRLSTLRQSLEAKGQLLKRFIALYEDEGVCESWASLWASLPLMVQAGVARSVHVESKEAQEFLFHACSLFRHLRDHGEWPDLSDVRDASPPFPSAVKNLELWFADRMEVSRGTVRNRMTKLGVIDDDEKKQGAPGLYFWSRFFALRRLAEVEAGEEFRMQQAILSQIEF